MRKAARSSPRNTDAFGRDAVSRVTSASSESPPADCGFGKDRRLPDEAAYSRVFRKAFRSSDRYFTVLSRPNGSRAPRLGLAIAKKNCRQAVARNRLKRIIRESFRLRQAALGGLDIVVLNKPGAERSSNAELFASLAAHWRRSRKSRRGQDDDGSNDNARPRKTLDG